MIVYIRENSRLARIAALRLGKPNAAMVIGNTIYLWGATRKEFLGDVRWMRHEVAHVYQYRKYGLLVFLYFYFLESTKKGYYDNRLEDEARRYEKDEKILDGVVFR